MQARKSHKDYMFKIILMTFSYKQRIGYSII